MLREGRSYSGHERHCFFLNTGSGESGQGRFADTSFASGLDFPDDGRSTALVDWDFDGDLDMWLFNRNAPRLRLMRNDQEESNHWVAFRLEGNGQTTNRDAIGARLELKLAGFDHPLIQTLRAGEGFLSQSSKWLHFGVGPYGSIEQVTVRWPGGDAEVFSGLNIDTFYHLAQGAGQAKPFQPPPTTVLEPGVQKPAPRSEQARIPLVDLITVPDGQYEDFFVPGRSLGILDKRGAPIVITFWSATCPHCRKELHEFSRRYDELREHGVELLALSIDRLQDSSEGETRARELATEQDFPFDLGFATRKLAAAFQILHNLHIAIHRQMPLPSSFLIDESGRLSVIYKGPVSVDQVIRDLDHAKKSRRERFVDAARLSGSTIDHPRVDQIGLKNAFLLSYRFGDTLLELGRADLAISQYRDAIRLKDDFAEAHLRLGQAYAVLGRSDLAMEELRHALELDPDSADVHNGLGEALAMQRKLAEAIEHFRRAVELEPDHLAARANLEKAIRIQDQQK